MSAAGLQAIRLPLFAVTPVAWSPPDPAGFDALLITSANAILHAGEGLAVLRPLPVIAVGAASAAAASDAGFEVAVTGDDNAAGVIAAAADRGLRCLLHLGGRDRTPSPPAATIEHHIVYASDLADVSNAAILELEDALALVHSARGAHRLSALADRAGLDRGRVRIVAIAPHVAAAAGSGWGECIAVDVPTDAAMVALAVTRAIDRPGARGDKVP